MPKIPGGEVPDDGAEQTADQDGERKDRRRRRRGDRLPMVLATAIPRAAAKKFEDAHHHHGLGRRHGARGDHRGDDVGGIVGSRWCSRRERMTTVAVASRDEGVQGKSPGGPRGGLFLSGCLGIMARSPGRGNMGGRLFFRQGDLDGEVGDFLHRRQGALHRVDASWSEAPVRATMQAWRVVPPATNADRRRWPRGWPGARPPFTASTRWGRGAVSRRAAPVSRNIRPTAQTPTRAAPAKPDGGIHPGQAPELAGEQRHDGAHRGGGVGQDVQVGRLEVEVGGVVVGLPWGGRGGARRGCGRTPGVGARRPTAG